MRKPAFAPVLALCALLSACPESIHPISDPAGAAHDDALLGVWRGSFEQGTQVYLHVGKAERGLSRALMVEHDQQGRVKVEHYVAFPSRVDRLDLLNVLPVDESGERGYALFRYRADKHALTLWMLSSAAAREDIQAGKLKGIARGGPYGETRITASSEELVSYLKRGDVQRLFEKPLEFRRVGGK